MIQLSTHYVIIILIVLFIAVVHYSINIALMYAVKPSQCDAVNSSTTNQNLREASIWIGYIGLIAVALVIIFLLGHVFGIAKV